MDKGINSRSQALKLLAIPSLTVFYFDVIGGWPSGYRLEVDRPPSKQRIWVRFPLSAARLEGNKPSTLATT